MITLGCRKHPRYEAKSLTHEPQCRCCFDLWRLKFSILYKEGALYTLIVYPEELKVKP